MEKISDQEKIRFRIPGDNRYLFLVRTVVTALARASGFPDDEVDKIEIAVDEACTNVLDHAYRDVFPKPPIDIEIHTDEERFVIDVIDHGLSFDFSAYVPPKFPDHWIKGQTRGVGLYLIQQCMDTTEYEQMADNMNRFRLVKKIGKADRAEANAGVTS